MLGRATRMLAGRSFAPRPAARFLSSFNASDPDLYRVYLVTDDKYLDGSLQDKVLEACRGGATIVQLRLKNASTSVYVDQARAIKAAMHENKFAHVPLVIDDRLDVCLAADADGLHVGDGDMDCRDARRLLPPGKVLGVSCYGELQRLEEAREAGADYVAGGSVMPSRTKTTTAKGFAHLHDFKLAAGDLPVVAIGGITVDSAFASAYAGADGICCVSEFLEPAVDDVARVVGQVKQQVEHATVAKKNSDKFNPGEDCVNGESLAIAVMKIRETKPLVHCLTNYVSMDIMANVLLACGASPAMIHAKEEAAEFAAIASAVSINPGTLSARWVESMLEVAAKCSQLRKPWVLDPVGAGASVYRTGVIADLARQGPTVLRGNPGEIMVTAAQLGITPEEEESAGPTQGVDSLVDSAAILASSQVKAVDALARKIGGIVVMTGSTDMVTDGGANRFLIRHDAPELQNITATGCSLSSLIAAFISLDSDHPARAAAHACAYYSLAAEQVTLENRLLGRGPLGPGSMRSALLDKLHSIDIPTLRAMARIEKAH